ncbi:MAG: hypothetical protein ACP5UV_04540 [Thermoplasmata archaeon]
MKQTMERFEKRFKPLDRGESASAEGPRNHSNPEPLNTSHIGKSVIVTLVE